MKKYWWIVCVVINTTESDGSPDSDSYPIERKEIFKLFGPYSAILCENFCEKITKNFANHAHATKKLKFIWCLDEKGKEDSKLADLLIVKIREKLALL